MSNELFSPLPQRWGEGDGVVEMVHELRRLVHGRPVCGSTQEFTRVPAMRLCVQHVRSLLGDTAAIEKGMRVCTHYLCQWKARSNGNDRSFNVHVWPVSGTLCDRLKENLIQRLIASKSFMLTTILTLCKMTIFSSCVNSHVCVKGSLNSKSSYTIYVHILP